MAFKHIIAIDPGDVNNGFCYFKYDTDTRKADLRIMEILGAKGLSDILKVMWGIGQAKERGSNENNPYDMFFVIENFRMDSMVRGAMFQWNQMLTSQMIGRVKLCAEWLDAPVFMQEPAITANGRKFVARKLPKHIPDDWSAFIHGAHFMLSKKLIQTVDQITLKGQGNLF
jgi:hypothetical protein